MVQNIAQPQRNPRTGENDSRRNTYTPPVRGKADESSAHTSAPNRVSTPETAHTRKIPPILPIPVAGVVPWVGGRYVTCRLCPAACAIRRRAPRLFPFPGL